MIDFHCIHDTLTHHAIDSQLFIVSQFRIWYTYIVISSLTILFIQSIIINVTPKVDRGKGDQNATLVLLYIIYISVE